jgi:hypothetical protein
MRAPRFALSAVFVASTLTQPLSAQNQAPAPSKKSIGFTAGAALTYGNLTGGDFDGTKTRRLTPYIAARVGKAMASYDESYGGTSDADGWIYGLGAGVLWPLAKSVQVDGALHYARVSHDYGSGDYSESEKGNLISMRAGVRIFR